VRTRNIFLISLVATMASFYAVAWMKLEGVAAGKLVLDYLFVPVGLFLFVDGVWSLFRDDRYLATRFCRIIIFTIYTTIHVQMLLSR
jgi:hypothetical protein